MKGSQHHRQNNEKHATTIDKMTKRARTIDKAMAKPSETTDKTTNSQAKTIAKTMKTSQHNSKTNEQTSQTANAS